MNKTWREKIDAAYAANTGAKLAAQEADRIARNNAFAQERDEAKSVSAPLTRQEIAYLKEEEAEMDVSIEAQIKQTVRERHCSRAEAKNWLRDKGLA